MCQNFNKFLNEFLPKTKRKIMYKRLKTKIFELIFKNFYQHKKKMRFRFY